MKKLHYLARALIVQGGMVLLARQIGAKNTFLPGGHIGLMSQLQAHSLARFWRKPD